MRLLCVSDIHGRLGALQAVLATAEKRAFEKLLVAGDLLFPGNDALETWRRLNSAGAILVQGVTDRALATLDPKKLSPRTPHEEQMRDRMIELRAELGDVILERVKRLPTSIRFPLESGQELLLVHGSPRDATEGMSHDMSDEELNALLGDDPADIVVCGMTAVPFERTVSGVHIINVGSVGEAPPDGLVAHATWIETSPTGISVEQVVIPLTE